MDSMACEEVIFIEAKLRRVPTLGAIVKAATDGRGIRDIAIEYGYHPWIFYIRYKLFLKRRYLKQLSEIAEKYLGG